jgi:hypothetical protein
LFGAGGDLVRGRGVDLDGDVVPDVGGVFVSLEKQTGRRGDDREDEERGERVGKYASGGVGARREREIKRGQ